MERMWSFERGFPFRALLKILLKASLIKSQRYKVTARGSTQKIEQGAKKENSGLSEIKNHENK